MCLKNTQPGFGMLLLSRAEHRAAPLFVLHSFAHLSCDHDDDDAVHFITGQVNTGAPPPATLPTVRPKV